MAHPAHSDVTSHTAAQTEAEALHCADGRVHDSDEAAKLRTIASAPATLDRRAGKRGGIHLLLLPMPQKTDSAGSPGVTTHSEWLASAAATAMGAGASSAVNSRSVELEADIPISANTNTISNTRESSGGWAEMATQPMGKENDTTPPSSATMQPISDAVVCTATPLSTHGLSRNITVPFSPHLYSSFQGGGAAALSSYTHASPLSYSTSGSSSTETATTVLVTNLPSISSPSVHSAFTTEDFRRDMSWHEHHQQHREERTQRTERELPNSQASSVATAGSPTTAGRHASPVPPPERAAAAMEAYSSPEQQDPLRRQRNNSSASLTANTATATTRASGSTRSVSQHASAPSQLLPVTDVPTSAGGTEAIPPQPQPQHGQQKWRQHTRAGELEDKSSSSSSSSVDADGWVTCEDTALEDIVANENRRSEVASAKFDRIARLVEHSSDDDDDDHDDDTDVDASGEDGENGYGYAARASRYELARAPPPPSPNVSTPLGLGSTAHSAHGNSVSAAGTGTDTAIHVPSSKANTNTNNSVTDVTSNLERLSGCSASTADAFSPLGNNSSGVEGSSVTSMRLHTPYSFAEDSAAQKMFVDFVKSTRKSFLDHFYTTYPHHPPSSSPLSEVSGTPLGNAVHVSRVAFASVRSERDLAPPSLDYSRIICPEGQEAIDRCLYPPPSHAERRVQRANWSLSGAASRSHSAQRGDLLLPGSECATPSTTKASANSVGEENASFQDTRNDQRAPSVKALNNLAAMTFGPFSWGTRHDQCTWIYHKLDEVTDTGSPAALIRARLVILHLYTYGSQEMLRVMHERSDRFFDPARLQRRGFTNMDSPQISLLYLFDGFAVSLTDFLHTCISGRTAAVADAADAAGAQTTTKATATITTAAAANSSCSTTPFISSSGGSATAPDWEHDPEEKQRLQASATATRWDTLLSLAGSRSLTSPQTTRDSTGDAKDAKVTDTVVSDTVDKDGRLLGCILRAGTYEGWLRRLSHAQRQQFVLSVLEIIKGATTIQYCDGFLPGHLTEMEERVMAVYIITIRSLFSCLTSVLDGYFALRHNSCFGRNRVLSARLDEEEETRRVQEWGLVVVGYETCVWQLSVFFAWAASLHMRAAIQIPKLRPLHPGFVTTLKNRLLRAYRGSVQDKDVRDALIVAQKAQRVAPEATASSAAAAATAPPQSPSLEAPRSSKGAPAVKRVNAQKAEKDEEAEEHAQQRTAIGVGVTRRPPALSAARPPHLSAQLQGQQPRSPVSDTEDSLRTTPLVTVPPTAEDSSESGLISVYREDQLSDFELLSDRLSGASSGGSCCALPPAARTGGGGGGGARKCRSTAQQHQHPSLSVGVRAMSTLTSASTSRSLLPVDLSDEFYKPTHSQPQSFDSSTGSETDMLNVMGRRRDQSFMIVADDAGFDSTKDATRFCLFRTQVLGRGSFGTVYKCWDGARGSFLACKEMHLDASTTNEEQTMAALFREYSLLTSLRHPNIVGVVGFVVEENKGRIFMEWMPSGSVQSVLELLRDGLRENVVRRFVRDALHGLDYLHSKGIIHRDVKPGNMLLDASGTLKLTDFGSSRSVLQTNAAQEASLKTFSVVGTLAYISPDSVRGHYSFASDIWSLGCSAIHMVTGQPPWGGESLESVGLIFKIGSLTEANHLPPLVHRERLSPAFMGFMEKALTFDRHTRPTASELLQHPFVTGLESDESSGAAL